MAVEVKEEILDRWFEDTFIYDPVTQELMQDPVKNACGHTFNRKTAEDIAAQSVKVGGQYCPCCRGLLTFETFRPDDSLKEFIGKLMAYSAEREKLITQLQERVEDHIYALKRKEHEWIDLTQQLQESQKLVLLEQQNREEIERELKNLKVVLSVKNQQLQQSKQNLKESKAEVTHLNQVLNRSGVEKIKQLREKIADKNREMNKLKEDIQYLKNKHQVLSDHEEALRARVEEKSKEFSTLALSLNKLTTEKEALEHRVQALEKSQILKKQDEEKSENISSRLPRNESKKSELKNKKILSEDADVGRKKKMITHDSNRVFKIIYALPALLMMFCGREWWGGYIFGRTNVAEPQLTVREEFLEGISIEDAGKIERAWKSAVEVSDNAESLYEMFSYHLPPEYSTTLPKIFLKNIALDAEKTAYRASSTFEVENEPHTALLAGHGFFAENGQMQSVVQDLSFHLPGNRE